MLGPKVIKAIEKAQVNELTENIIYTKLAEKTKDRRNRDILIHIAEDEARHAAFWEKITGKSLRPNRLKAWFYIFLSRLLGLVFGLKLMEKGEDLAQSNYAIIVKSYPQAISIQKDEHEHEQKIIGMLKERKLEYVGSIVLGLNDALVELTGALAGFTLALKDTKLIALVGLITGIAASLSMAASEYLSMKEEKSIKNPLTAAFYTGVAYIITVFILVMPFLIINEVMLALTVTMVLAIFIVFLFTFYTSVANDLPFRRRFLNMALISLGVAAISFGIGHLIRALFGIEA